MGGVCSKKPAVKHDVDGTADDTAPNLPHISPLPAVPEGKAAATGVAATGARVSNGELTANGDHADLHHPSSVRLSFESVNGDGGTAARISGSGRLSEDGDAARPRAGVSARALHSPSRK